MRVRVDGGPQQPAVLQVSSGLPGADGSDGASAYEIAAAAGFEGSEEEWLASLVGAPGADGQNGTDGVDGAPGAPGEQGPPGVWDGAISKSIVITPAAIGSYVIWRAPIACTVTAVRGYRVGGTGATVNATRSGADLLAADLSLSTAATWLSGPGIQGGALAVGDTLAVAIRNTTGSPTAITIQVDIQGV
ncbi:hypothetical protein ACFVDU_04530 [Streptomyces albidoflavus]